MATALQNEHVSFDDYIEGERDVDIRSEYVDGQVYAMAGASETHNTIAASLSAAYFTLEDLPMSVVIM